MIEDFTELSALCTELIENLRESGTDLDVLAATTIENLLGIVDMYDTVFNTIKQEGEKAHNE